MASTTRPGAGKRSSTSTALAFDGSIREGSRLRARSLVGGAGRPDGEGASAATTTAKMGGIGMSGHATRSTSNLPRLDESRRTLGESSESGSDDLGPPTPPHDPSLAARARMSFELPKMPSASQFMSIAIPPTPAGEAAPALLGRRFSIVTNQPTSTATLPAAAVGPSSSPPDARPPLQLLVRPIAVLACVFVTSTAIVFALVASVPALALPHSLADVMALADRLRQYSSSGSVAWLHVLVVLSTLFCWKQAFSIPGSILMNVLFGASYSLIPATLYTCLLTAIGSTGAYALAYFCEPLVRAYVPKPIEALERRMDGKVRRPRELFSSLLVLRLVPIIPYSVVNAGAGVLRLPLWPFFASLALGSVPFQLVTCKVGSLLLAPGASIESIWSARSALELFLISAVAAAPVIFKRQLQTLLGGAPSADDEAEREAMVMQPTRRTASSDSDEELSSPMWTRRKASVFDASVDVERGDAGDEDDGEAGIRPSVTITGPPLW